MKKVFLFLLAYCCSVAVLDAQSQPVYNVPSPEVANLGLYGQVPVSYYTGVPDISVPLYEVKVGNFSMPITASYHIGSVKPNQTPGPLGLGWNLIAGGYITRTVHCFYDEQKTFLYEPGYYANCTKMKGITAATFEELNKKANSDGFYGTTKDDNEYFELSADEFHFDFCGYSGNFYLNEDGGWTVVSESDIKVEFNPSDGFASLEDLRKSGRWKRMDWEASCNNQRFFIRFAIITPDGTRFEFGGINATEFSISYYARNVSDLIATSWRLSKITTPEGYVIDFDYDTSGQTCDIEYKPYWIQYKQFFKNREEIVNKGYNPNRTGNKALTGFLNFPVFIKSIETPNEAIDFTYNLDKLYGRRLTEFTPGGKGYAALFWDEQERNHDIMTYESRATSLSEAIDSEPDHFLLLMNNAVRERTEAQTIYSIAGSMVNKLLHRIAVKKKNNGSSQSVYFDYTSSGREKLSLISKLDYVPELKTKWVQNPHGVVEETGYLLPDDNEVVVSRRQNYSFKYNQGKNLFWGYIVSKTDSWGFWTGESNEREFMAGVPASQKPKWGKVVRPNLEATKAETLVEMTYPTGGRSLFEYELNDYSKLIDTLSCTRIVNEIGKAGGLRIKSITNLDRNNSFISKERYYYSEKRVPTNEKYSSGICRGLPVFCTCLDHEITLNVFMRPYPITIIDAYVNQIVSGGVYAPVTNMNSPVVGYTWVIAESVDSIGNTLGSVRYRYSNYDADINDICHLDEPSYVSPKKPADNYMEGLAPYTSVSFERGKLLSKEYMDKDDIVYKKEVYNYPRTNHSPLLLAHQNVIYMGDRDDYSMVFESLGWLTYTHTASYLPVSVTETIRSTDGQMVEYKTQTYEYNEHKKLKQETCTMSDGSRQSVSYTYPFDYSKYDWMTAMNITDPVIEKKLTAGGLTRSETSVYGSYAGIPYIQKRTIGNGHSTIKTEYEVKRVDSYGNPIEMVIDGVNNVLCWGHQGQRLLIRVENADYVKLKYLLDLNGTSADYSKLLNGRSKLPSALFHIYKYNSDLQLESETSPNGVTTIYDYDHFGRLKEVYYISGGEKKLLKSFEYQYYNDKCRKM